MSLRDELIALTASDVEPVPGMDRVFVRSLAVSEAEQVDKLIDAKVNALVAWTVIATCDASGQRCFDEGDVEAVAKMPLKKISAIAKAALKLNGLSKAQVEDAEKN